MNNSLFIIAGILFEIQLTPNVTPNRMKVETQYV